MFGLSKPKYYLCSVLTEHGYRRTTKRVEKSEVACPVI